ncbi:MAG: DedA family protein [Candidatus Thioglobus sp.]|nr:DedA family protein [Candidatus Thioglobus pontius]MBL6976457.1 DedA family protein [Candidatus Thioglobus sp.]MBL6984072.1 DedA family protein [Candidatus Thioglobus sp.]
MQIFSKIYQTALNWAHSRFAVYWLSAVSFLESSVLPYPPPDVLLAPMALKQPNKAYSFASIATIFSVLGGLAGYFLGDILLDFLLNYGLVKPESVVLIKSFFDEYGIWVVGIAAFSPIPYKLATISAGSMAMPILPFVAISIVARAARYYLVAGLVQAYGDACDQWLQKYIDRLGYGLIVIVIVGVWYVD